MRFIVLCFFLLLHSYNFCQEKEELIDELVQKCHKDGTFSGNILVAEKGKILYETSLGLSNVEFPILHNSETKFLIGSISKQFTAALTLKAYEKGLLDINESISSYLEEFPKSRFQSVTIYHLMTNSSGLYDFTRMSHYWSDSVMIQYSEEQLIDLVNDSLKKEAGIEFEYNNTNFYLLAIILEKTTSKSFDDLLRDWILNPLEMSNTGIYYSGDLVQLAKGYIHTLDGFRKSKGAYMPNNKGMGQMYSTSKDLFKWHTGLNGSSVLQDSLKKIMFKENKGKYGCGWQVRHWSKSNGDPYEVVFHGGMIAGFHCYISRNLSDDMLIVILDNHNSQVAREMTKQIRRIQIDENFMIPKKPLSFEIRQANSTDLFDSLINYLSLNSEKIEKYYSINEMEINKVGYEFLNVKEYSSAVEVFKLNASLFPESWNVYDSLGEAFLRNGAKQNAKINYQKSLELNPNNVSAIKALKQINN